ncbi:MAG: MFS transporter [Candidatus Omnitrophota bacterium]
MTKPDKLRKSLKASFIDGAFAAAMTGFTEQYITPFAIALRATGPQIGMLTAFPNLVASLAQLKSADFTEHLKSRMRVINFFIFLHAFMFIPILAIPFVFKENTALWLVLFVTLSASLNAFPGSSWASLMSDHIPPSSRGRYFGWRNRLLGAITVACAFLAGFILNVFGKGAYIGFVMIFALACVCRFVSWHFLSKMYEPPIKIKKEHYFSFWDFIRRTKHSNFAKFVFYAAGINFSVNVSAPFFAVFMLSNLNFSYVTYTVVVTASSIATLLTMNIWGRHADITGNFKVIKLTSFFIPAVPVLWLFSHKIYYLILIQIFGGFVWAGFNLSVSNFIYDAVMPEKRTRCISYFNVINGSAICLGALTGGLLAKILPALFGYRLLTLFLLSGIMRSAFACVFLPMIKEVRRVENIKSADLFFSIIGLRPLKIEADKSH